MNGSGHPIDDKYASTRTALKELPLGGLLLDRCPSSGNGLIKMVSWKMYQNGEQELHHLTGHRRPNRVWSFAISSENASYSTGAETGVSAMINNPLLIHGFVAQGFGYHLNDFLILLSLLSQIILFLDISVLCVSNSSVSGNVKGQRFKFTAHLLQHG